MTALWTSLFVIIVVAISIWVLYYVIRAAVRNGVVDAFNEMGLSDSERPASDPLQAKREALQEERVRAIVADETRKQSARQAK